ncbi:Fibronectin type III domain containing protein 3B, partial [Dissostichus eleginoides]
MYVTMMMTDQIPLDLAPPPLLNGEVPLMPHMVNGDAAQQVILVQVNPGETFTIRAEDGSLQCIQVYISSSSLISLTSRCSVGQLRLTPTPDPLHPVYLTPYLLGCSHDKTPEGTLRCSPPELTQQQ